MKRWLTVFLMAGAGVLVGPPAPACACSCAALSAAEAAARADLVVDGLVIDVDKPAVPIESSIDDITVTVRVQAVHKGRTGQREIRLVTARDGASCGAELSVGRVYRVYVDEVAGVLRTSLCSGNRELAAASGVGSDPASGAAGAGPPAERGRIPAGQQRLWRSGAGGAAVAVVGVLLLLVLLRRRRRAA